MMNEQTHTLINKDNINKSPFNWVNILVEKNKITICTNLLKDRLLLNNDLINNLISGQICSCGNYYFLELDSRLKVL